MNKWLNHARALLVAVVLSAALPAMAAPPDKYLYLQMDGGGSRVWTPSNTRFDLSGDRTEVYFSAALNTMTAAVSPYWYIHLKARPGETLQPGQYLRAGCSRIQHGRAPGIHITENNPVCSGDKDNVSGWFVIRQIAFDEAGQVTSIEASFRQDAGPNSPVGPLSGVLRYNSQPLWLSLQPTDDFLWADLSARSSYGDSAMFSLSGNVDSSVYYVASVLRDRWVVTLSPPTGKRLSVGTYAIQQAPTSTLAGLYINRVSAGSAAPRCSSPSGQLQVIEIAHDADGTIKRLRAKFTYRCLNTPGELKGEIRYLL